VTLRVRVGAEVGVGVGTAVGLTVETGVGVDVGPGVGLTLGEGGVVGVGTGVLVGAMVGDAVMMTVGSLLPPVQPATPERISTSSAKTTSFTPVFFMNSAPVLSRTLTNPSRHGDNRHKRDRREADPPELRSRGVLRRPQLHCPMNPPR
jgi:hypothetical protein